MVDDQPHPDPKQTCTRQTERIYHRGCLNHHKPKIPKGLYLRNIQTTMHFLCPKQPDTVVQRTPEEMGKRYKFS